MTETMSADLVVSDTKIDSALTAQALIDGLKAGGGGVVSTLTGTDFDTKVAIFDAVTNADDVADHLNETIVLANIIAQPIVITDDETGELVTVVRTVIIDADGTAYGAISNGIVRALQTLFQVVGQPSTWEKPLPIKVVQEGQGTRKYFTIKIVKPAAKK